MVTKKKKAGTVRTRTVYRAKKAYRRKSPNAAIPGAMATVGLLYANKRILSDIVKYSNGTPKGIVDATARVVKSGRPWTVDQLTKDAMYVAGGYIGGEVVKKYAPSVLKKPIAAISKKIPKIIR